jgi:hypothetical protein
LKHRQTPEEHPRRTGENLEKAVYGRETGLLFIILVRAQGIDLPSSKKESA